MHCDCLVHYRHRHSCTRRGPLKVTSKKAATAKVADHIIMARNDLYWVQDIKEDGTLSCNPLLLSEFRPSNLRLHLPWRLVGVYRSVSNKSTPTLDVTDTRLSTASMESTPTPPSTSRRARSPARQSDVMRHSSKCQRTGFSLRLTTSVLMREQ